MGRDTRKFSIETLDDIATMWATLLAIEKGASDAAQQFEHDIQSKVAISHSTGEYVRDTVGAARETAERNGFEPEYVRLDVDRIQYADPPNLWLAHNEAWVRARTSRHLGSIDVEVLHGSEVEVNGVFTMLHDAARAAIHVPATTEPEPVLTPGLDPKPWWQRLLVHPWIVGISTSFLVAVAIGYFGFFR